MKTREVILTKVLIQLHVGETKSDVEVGGGLSFSAGVWSYMANCTHIIRVYWLFFFNMLEMVVVLSPSCYLEKVYLNVK